MKKLILAALLFCISIGVNAQEYKMVVQKTDGSETMYNYSDELSVTMLETGIHIMDLTNEIHAMYLFSDIEKIYFISTSSLNNVAMKDAVLLYPNPAASSLHIAGAENQRVEIYSMDGKQVYNGINDGKEINVSSLEKGIYAVKIDGKTLKFAKL